MQLNATASGRFTNSILCLICLTSELEWRLSETGAVKTDLEENPKKQIEDKLMSSIRCSIPTKNDSGSEDEDD